MAHPERSVSSALTFLTVVVLSGWSSLAQPSVVTNATWAEVLVHNAVPVDKTNRWALILMKHSVPLDTIHLPRYLITIDTITPSRVTEQRTARISFSIIPLTGPETGGFVSADITEGSGQANKAMIGDKAAKVNVQVKRGEETSGTLSFTAPLMGAYHLRVNLRPPIILSPITPARDDTVLATVEINLDVFERPTILYTDFANPNLGTSDPKWTTKVSSGHTWIDNFDTWKTHRPRYEWNPVFSPDNEDDDTVVGISGWVIEQHPSTKDVPFTHPFGEGHFDYNMDVVLDHQYADLSANLIGGNDDERKELLEFVETRSLGVDEATPILHIETDMDFLPIGYRPSIPGNQNDAATYGITRNHFNRAVIFGRLIVDCGHDNFQTEIHPPLLYVFADASDDQESTICTVISRPWLVSQEFGDGALPEHFLNELSKLFTRPKPQDAGGWIARIAEDIVTGGAAEAIPGSVKIEARVRLKSPFTDFHLLDFHVRAPSPRKDPQDKLMVAYNFKVRPGVVIHLQKDIDEDSLHVFAEFVPNSFKPAPHPAARDWNLSLADLNRFEDHLGDYIAVLANSLHVASFTGLFGTIPPSLLTSIGAPAALQSGIMASRYDPPSQPDLTDALAIGAEISQLGGGPHYREDGSDGYVWPVAGWLSLYWARGTTPFSGIKLPADVVARLRLSSDQIVRVEPSNVLSAHLSPFLRSALDGHIIPYASFPRRSEPFAMRGIEMEQGKWEFRLTCPNLNRTVPDASSVPTPVAITQQICITNNVARDLTTVLPVSSSRGWRITEAQATNNLITWKAAHTNEYLATADGALRYHNASAEGEIKVQLKEPDHDVMPFVLTLTGRRLGDCEVR